MSEERSSGDFSEDEKRRLLRAVADEIRGDDTASRQVAAIVYRVSDIYDPDEDTDPEHVYRNVKEILRIKEQGGKEPGE